MNERDWLVRLTPPGDGAKLFCFPFAGGASSAYKAWGSDLEEGTEVFAVELPGRGRRFGAPPPTSIAEVCKAAAQAIEPHAQDTYFLYGHSMGAILAFETAHVLERRGARRPAGLIVSGCIPPSARPGHDGEWSFTDEQVLRRLKAMGGIPSELLKQPEVLELFLPCIRSDLRLIDTYAGSGKPRLPIPITAFAGLSDIGSEEARMKDWRLETQAGFSIRSLPGGHFFIQDRASFMPALRRVISEMVIA